MKYVGIIPLIGGMDIAHGKVLGHRPEYLVSWTPFSSNDSHLVNYYEGEVPYVLVDNGDKRPAGKIDVVHSTCPCAGLSTLSKKASPLNPINEWMTTCAEYVMGEMRPEVYWGENAPALSTAMGTPVREKIREVGKKHGYVMSCYKTKSLLHGVPQIRERTFYFFWRGNHVPLLNYYARPHVKIEDLISAPHGNFQTEPVRPGKITADPLYTYAREALLDGASHRDIVAGLEKTTQILDIVQSHVPGKEPAQAFLDAADWLRAHDMERTAAFCERVSKKFGTDSGMMRRSINLPKDYIGAFVGYLPTNVAHPVEDRHLSYRECMAIMGLPDDFELLSPKRNLNHVCQNVPVGTASDMVEEVRAALEGERPRIRADYVFQSNHRQTHESLIDDKPTIEGIFS